MLKQTFQQKLLQKLSPQQIQLMKLLQVPTVELEQRIKQEIEENPALEEGEDELEEELRSEEDEREEETPEDEEFDISDYLDDDDTPDYKLSANNSTPDDEEKRTPLSVGATFQEMMERQLGLLPLDDRTHMLALNLIGNLDESGYLRRELENVVNDLAFSANVECTEEELEVALHILQQLDPPGVGARNLRECLLIQIQRKDTEVYPTDIALKVLDKYFDAFTKKHYEKITTRLELTDDELRDAIEEIVKLNPKPGNTLRDTAKPIQEVIPDFILNNMDGKLELSLNGRNAPELRISRTYRNMLQEYNKDKSSKQQKEALMFVKKKIDGAKWFIDAIKQRQNTLLYTMNAIMEYQRDFFLSGDETKMKPMILKDIAEIVQMDISTVSRVANSKYVQTPYGTYLLKYFFSESLSTDSGEEVSTREVKKILQDAIDAEEKRTPLTDEKLMELLKDKGYNIARRTVAKYREQLNIPVARLRKQL